MLSKDFGNTRIIYGKQLDIFCLIATYYMFLEYIFKLYFRHFCFLHNTCYNTLLMMFWEMKVIIFIGLLAFLDFVSFHTAKEIN